MIDHHFPKLFQLVGGFNLSEKYESQLGLLFPVYGKIKFMFQSPPTSHAIKPFPEHHEGTLRAWLVVPARGFGSSLPPPPRAPWPPSWPRPLRGSRWRSRRAHAAWHSAGTLRGQYRRENDGKHGMGHAVNTHTCIYTHVYAYIYIYHLKPNRKVENLQKKCPQYAVK